MNDRAFYCEGQQIIAREAESETTDCVASDLQFNLGGARGSLQQAGFQGWLELIEVLRTDGRTTGLLCHRGQQSTISVVGILDESSRRHTLASSFHSLDELGAAGANAATVRHEEQR